MVSFMKKNTAFTLAEVMLTIAIIGIVVAITIITLMLNTNRAEFKTGFK
ncbi:prepilin-type N-terminal cleavage/methylation domain-containing protein, partial [bacterium]|nr:prepilin-type N-terminal cleavage/methylation domain-containing protein [bacterium]